MPLPGGGPSTANPYPPYPISGNSFMPYPSNSFGNFPPYPVANSSNNPPTGSAGYPPYMPPSNSPGYNKYGGSVSAYDLQFSFICKRN